jgi:hypothetical protein
MSFKANFPKYMLLKKVHRDRDCLRRMAAHRRLLFRAHGYKVEIDRLRASEAATRGSEESNANTENERECIAALQKLELHH